MGPENRDKHKDWDDGEILGERLQAALAGHGVIRVTATYAKAACDAGLLRPVLPDHVCEPLNVHALLPTRQFVPAKVRVFLDALDAHAYARPPALADL